MPKRIQKLRKIFRRSAIKQALAHRHKKPKSNQKAREILHEDVRKSPESSQHGNQKALKPSQLKPEDASVTSQLCSLPNEILHYIASLLPPHAVASLAFSCKSMQCSLGDQVWSRLKKVRTEKIIFLELLQSRLPNHRLCHFCAIFHALEKNTRDHYRYWKKDKCIRDVVSDRIHGYEM